MAKKSTVPDNILHRVLQKSRKKISKQHKETNPPKTLMEVFENEEEDPNHRG